MKACTEKIPPVILNLAIVIIVAVLCAVAAHAWGDNGGGRASYTVNQINSGVLGNRIVFNSISNSTIGDEKNFVGARENTGVNAGAANVWNGNDITVEDGKEYIIRLYVHNNSPLGTSAISRNTRVAFNLPTTSAKQVQVNGYIFSDNATPSEYWDYVNFNANQAFHLEYVYGSALLENNGIGANGGYKLGDEIVTKAASQNGVQIGYDKIDGNIPGCYEYASYVSIRVKAVFDYTYTVSQYVRKAGLKDWSSDIKAKLGDKVEIQIAYDNIDSQQQNNVMVKVSLPQNLRYVPNSTKLYNADYPNGVDVQNDDVIFTGINIGHYEPSTNAFIKLTAEVIDEKLEPGTNILVNWAQISIGRSTQQDYATIRIQKARVSDAILITFDVLFIISLLAASIMLLKLRKDKQS